MGEKGFDAISERVKVSSDPLLVRYWDNERFRFDRNLFDPLVATHRAWMVMLAEEGIIPRQDAVPVLVALRELAEAGYDSMAYHAGHDMYTHVENWLRERAGREPVGHLSLARTRPEPLLRMYFRGRVLNCIDQLDSRRRNLVTMYYSSTDHKGDTIAAKFSMTPNALRQSLFRIRKILLECVMRTMRVGAN